jgi:hypothetical protein
MSIGGGLFVIVGLAISIPFWLSHRGKAAATEDIGSATK